MKRNKQIILMILCLFLSIVATSCSSDKREAKYSLEEEYLSFDEAIGRSFCIVPATLEEIIESDDYREYLFSLEKTSKGNMYIDVDAENLNELSAYIDNVYSSVKISEAYGIPFTRSDKLSEIMPASEYILRVKIDGISIKAPKANRDTYYCTVIENLKGSTDNKIQAVLFKGTVTEGEEYILLLNKESENSLLYTLSSRNSVISSDQTDNQAAGWVA